MEKKVTTGNGVSSIDLLQLLFIALKLMGYINWSWWWVLAPTWIFAILVILVVIIFD